LCWNPSGITVLGTGSSGSSSILLNNPYNLVIDSSGSFYVADYGNNRVQKFTASSSFATTVAGQANTQWGSASNELNQPQRVLVDSNDNLYVLDTNNHRVQYFASGSTTGVTVAGIGKFLSTSVLH
jgi:sugar lactone lactonase YvrE